MNEAGHEASRDEGLPLSEDLFRAVDRVADAICRRGLAAPALLFIELHRPLAGLLHSAALVGGPLVHALFGREAAKIGPAIFESPEAIDRLVNRIEAGGAT